MQDMSFDFKTPMYAFNGIRFGLQLFTFENIYTNDPAHTTTSCESEAIFAVHANRLMFAGGQEHAEGMIRLNASKASRGTRFTIEAKCQRRIRGVKLIIKDIPHGEVVNLRESKSMSIDKQGVILKYPNGWHHLATPLVVLRTREGKCLYFRSLDDSVREKRFAIVPKGDTYDVELIFDESAVNNGFDLSVPAWEIGEVNDPEEIYRDHTEFIEQTYQLEPWETRNDVPNWARDIALVASINCRHWTGYIFNNYNQVLDKLKWIADKIDGKRVLAYLPGWEGRYYWQYGEYRPDPAMGGDEEFARLVMEAKKLNIRVMPMFGITIVNRGFSNFEQFGAPAQMRTAGGNLAQGSPDWDSSRHYDHGWQVWLNPGSPTWQNYLVSQIVHLLDKFKFDGVYLDISALYANDPNWDTTDGIIELTRKIRKNHPNVLIGGEGWFDAIGRATPLTLSGHHEHVLCYHDEPYAPMFDNHSRQFGHLCMGDPSRGSTGVHEWGINTWDTRTPLRKGVIPTLQIVEDTLEAAPDKVIQIIEDAKEYARRYLK